MGKPSRLYHGKDTGDGGFQFIVGIGVDRRRWGRAGLSLGSLPVDTGPALRFIHRVASGDKTLHQRAGEAVLAEPAG
jgi:hypothetical protein